MRTAILFHAEVHRPNEWKESNNIFNDCLLSSVKKFSRHYKSLYCRSYCRVGRSSSSLDTNSFITATYSHTIFNHKCRWLTPLALKKPAQFASHLQEIQTAVHHGIVNWWKFVFPSILWTPQNAFQFGWFFFFLISKRKLPTSFLPCFCTN